MFAAFIGGTYYYYVNVYEPKQAMIKAAEQQKADDLQKQLAAEREQLAKKNSASRQELAKPAKATSKKDDSLTLTIPKARPITNGPKIKDSLKKEKPKTPEEIQREKELAEMRKILRAKQAEGERDS